MNFMNKKLQFYIWFFFYFYICIIEVNFIIYIYISAMHSMLITIKLFTHVHVIGKNRDQRISSIIHTSSNLIQISLVLNSLSIKIFCKKIII